MSDLKSLIGGEDSIDRIRDVNYQSNSHMFNKAVIAAYLNAFKYNVVVRPTYIHVKQQKRDVVLILSPDFDKTEVQATKKVLYYSEKPHVLTPKKFKEVAYNLNELFDAPSKQIRRGVNFMRRGELGVFDSTASDVAQMYEKWAQNKKSDPKVFQMTFNPDRYRRSFALKDQGFNIHQRSIMIKQQLYGVMSFALDQAHAYELAFMSCYFDKDLKLTNDQNECLIIGILHELYQNGFKTANLGTHAGIKGLKTFKLKLPHYFVEVYSS